MIYVSPMFNFIQALLPRRLRFYLHLHRVDRWGTFEHGYHLLPMLVDPNRAAIDVGGNEGLYAGKMARYTNVVYVFEPIPWFADDLRRKLPRRVKIHQTAVSNIIGRTTLRIPYKGSVEQHGTTTIEPSNKLENADSVQEISCDTVTLDSVVKEPVGFIKIDVEGHEISVLEGALRIIRSYHPIIAIESERRHNPRSPENVFELFQVEGYTGVVLIENKIFSLNHFSVDEHQSSDRLPKKYGNNFLFFPPLEIRCIDKL